MRVILAEDGALARDGLTQILVRFGHRVTEAVADSAALVRAVERAEPDIVVTDVRMPPSYTDEGLRAALVLRERVPHLPILVLSQYVELSYAAELLQSGRGGVGYLLKDRIADVVDFVDAVVQVAGGGTVIDPEVVRQLLRRTRSTALVDRLSPREGQVLALIAEGRSNASIARALVISETAVEKHVRGIFMKLDLPPNEEQHRRVLAVITYLRECGHPGGTASTATR
ncbi:response regulator [Plantactinospora sp. CA-290183]|uniref:response regulator n=1 Tax=Plantactinospora sp. CA-290183 TaxID=3240006 RepID=UPI003D94C2B2